jgi:hypothetical protein
MLYGIGFPIVILGIFSFKMYNDKGVGFESTVDWCESNYLLSNYFAEYWNTITGMCILLSGLIFYYNYKKFIYESKYTINFIRITILLLVVGIGTMLFHATLFYPFQLLDELPMILLANEYLTVLMSLKTTQMAIPKTSYDYLNNGLFITNKSLPFIILSYFIHPRLQIITFHITLKISELSVLYVLYNLSKKLNYIVYSKIYINNDYIKRQKQIYKQRIMMTSFINLNRTQTNYNYLKDSILLQKCQSLIKIYLSMKMELTNVIQNGIYLYSSSIFLWCIENMFCKYVESLQLHAIWHVLSSIGIYHLNIIMKKHIEIENFSSDDIIS